MLTVITTFGLADSLLGISPKDSDNTGRMLSGDLVLSCYLYNLNRGDRVSDRARVLSLVATRLEWTWGLWETGPQKIWKNCQCLVGKGLREIYRNSVRRSGGAENPKEFLGFAYSLSCDCILFSFPLPFPSILWPLLFFSTNSSTLSFPG